MIRSLIPQLQSPIVLVHGLFGFDKVRMAGVTVAEYFPGVKEVLEQAGNRVFVPCLSPTAAVAFRAKQLKDFILKNCPGEPVHIIAHSMGGLDSRYMISKLDMADRVLTLTTLGTPHRGTAFADWAMGSLRWMVQPVLELLSIPTQGFFDLTTEGCRRFNEEVVDSEKVRYFSVAAQHQSSVIHPEWFLPHSIVTQVEGPNDGVVSLSSASYGEASDVWEGDHFSLVNWNHPLDATRMQQVRDLAPRYGSLVARIADAGFK